jgi:hypothetical protein
LLLGLFGLFGGCWLGFWGSGTGLEFTSRFSLVCCIEAIGTAALVWAKALLLEAFAVQLQAFAVPAIAKFDDLFFDFFAFFIDIPTIISRHTFNLFLDKIQGLNGTHCLRFRSVAGHVSHFWTKAVEGLEFEWYLVSTVISVSFF